MDSTLETAFLSSGTVGIFAAVIFFLLRCLQKKKIISKCCGGEIDITEEQPQVIQVQGTSAPPSTPVLESRRASTTAVVGLKLDEESKV